MHFPKSIKSFSNNQHISNFRKSIPQEASLSFIQSYKIVLVKLSNFCDFGLFGVILICQLFLLL